MARLPPTYWEALLVADASAPLTPLAAALTLNIPPMWLMMALLVVLAAACIVILMLRWGSHGAGQSVLRPERAVSTSALRGYALAMLDVGQTQDAIRAVRAQLGQSPA